MTTTPATAFNKVLFVLFVILSLFQSSCTLRARHKGPQSPISNQIKILVKPTMSATELADAGEKLITPYTFMLADKTFSMALEKEAHQPKALFYKTFLKRFMIFKGIFTRIRPLVKQYGHESEFAQKVQNMPNSSLKNFLLDGSPDITNAESAQTFLNQYVQAINELREFLLRNAELELELSLNPALVGLAPQKDWGRSCRMVAASTQTFEIQCNPHDVTLQKLNAADLLLLRQISAGEIFVFSMVTSYSLKGLEELIQQEGYQKLPYTEKLALLKAQPEFLTLRADQFLHLWDDLAQDFVFAVRWAMNNQETLCPKGSQSTDPQRQNYLFSRGLCFPTEAQSKDSIEKLLTKIEQALAGTIPLLTVNTDGQEVQTQINPMLLAKQPIVDLKSLLPAQPVRCGTGPILPDNTLGGLFPNADAAEFISVKDCE